MKADPERLRADVQQALRDARVARESGDVAGRLDALARARDAAEGLTDDPSLFAAACWRLAKARYDAGVHDTLLDAVRPLLAEGRHAKGMFGVRTPAGPFDHYEPGVQAVAPLARRVADHLGYADPDLARLWDALAAWAGTRHEGFLHAWARTERAWIDAATGAIAAVRTTAHAVSAMRPGEGVGEHRHPRAARALDSIPWLQVDMARTRLRAEAWHGEARGAADALEELLDACAGVDLPPHHDPWVLDAILHADREHGLTEIADGWRAAWRELASAPGLSPGHQARLAAFALATPEAHHHAATQLHAERAGPEWVVGAWIDAARAADDPAARTAFLTQARDHAARTGVRHRDLSTDATS